MRKVLVVCLCLLLMTALTPIALSEGDGFSTTDHEVGPHANPIVLSASCSLSAGKSIVFMLTANERVFISVVSCSLYYYESGRWVSAGPVSLPAGYTGNSYGASSNCADLIQNGKKYRVECVFQAGTEQVSRSHERTY